MKSKMLKTDPGSLKKRLEKGIHPLWLKAEQGLVDLLVADFKTWEKTATKPDDARGGRDLGLVEFLISRIETDLKRISALHLRHAEFNQRYAHAGTEREKRDHILEFARDLGRTRRRLKGDKRAFSRWFGSDAVTERYLRQVADAERKIVFTLKRLAYVGGALIKSHGDRVGHRKLWRRLHMEKMAGLLLPYGGDSRIRIEAFRCLAQTLSALPEEIREGSLQESTTQYIYRSALERRQEVWIQCEALELLQGLSLSSLEEALKNRLTEPAGGDDLFVRHRSVMLLGNNLHRIPRLRDLFPQVAKDPSPYVRQAMAHALGYAEPEDLRTWMPGLVLGDPDTAVRAAALLEIPKLLGRRKDLQFLPDLLLEAMEKERTSFVLRVTMKISLEVLAVSVADAEGHSREKWRSALMERLDRFHGEAEDLSVRRWAAQTREILWLQRDPGAREIRDYLENRLSRVKQGKRKRVRRSLMSRENEETLGRVLSVMGQGDFGYDARRTLTGGTVTRGHVFRFRLWRLLYEFFHPSTDKRQGISHTTGRSFSGNIHAPSGIMNELTETKVPGEPLHMATESGWRPYLPLVDEVISSLDQGVFWPRPTRIYTSEGITRIKPPRFFPRRWLAKILLTLRFNRYAGLRNWNESGQAAPDVYLKSISRLGFKIRFQPYGYGGGSSHGDAAVERFFPAVLPFMDFDFGEKIHDFLSAILNWHLWPRGKEYFFSAYQNTLLDLGLYAGIIALIFFGANLYKKRSIKASRNRLSLVIGGWGTRGKSSVERLKAGLVNALGYSVLSKTTGCEAMFLHAHPCSKMREMFLFRPYDKATIWEQHKLTLLATALKTDAFLWECMALTPSYVRILQRDWMQDDMSTITNTYPDHEDVQGPAGFNIAEVMTNFIPENSLLISTEEHLQPILTEGARELGTRTRTVNWLDAGLVTSDTLNRFSYEEHPYNVALVLALAEELGIDTDFALKEMADRVIPDIGVLKVFPTAPLNSRRLEFINGMSGNERFACLSNWRRAELDRHDPEKEPGTWITAVVNNRADRVPRSKTFAQILVEDLSADRFFLIGSNLSGLKGYINETWNHFAANLTLWPESEEGKPREPGEILREHTRRLRIPTTEAGVKALLGAMILGQEGRPDPEPFLAAWNDPEKLKELLDGAGLESLAPSIVDHMKIHTSLLKAYLELKGRLTGSHGEKKESLDGDFKKFLRKCFDRKIVVIADFHATGNQIVHRICEETPPGYYNRIMGLQNIKGTGLDFVYCWQAWETCHAACGNLRHENPVEVERGLRALSAFQEYGLLTEEYTSETLAAVKESPVAQNEKFQAELTMISSRMKKAMDQVRAQSKTVRRSGGFVASVMNLIESFLDAGDAVKRRKKADRIYRDMVHECISHERAALELKALNKRQKGGWLRAQFSGVKNVLD